MRNNVVSGLIAMTAVLGTAVAAVVASPAPAAPAPAPARANAAQPDNELSGISCGTSNDCVAVGAPLTQTRNGKTWKLVTTP